MIDEAVFQKKMISRLRRISGQVAGVEKMLEAKKGCRDVVYQIMAARNALGEVATKMLTEESCKCAYKGEPDDLEKIIKMLIKIN